MLGQCISLLRRGLVGWELGHKSLLGKSRPTLSKEMRSGRDVRDVTSLL